MYNDVVKFCDASSSMKSFFKNLFLYMLISYFALTIFNGIDVPGSFVYLLATLLVFSIGMLMVSPLLNFLTIRENFITKFLLTSLISVGILYLLKIFMVDFYIEGYMFDGFQTGNLVLNSFEMLPIITIVGCSVVTGFISSLFFVLEKSK